MNQARAEESDTSRIPKDEILLTKLSAPRIRTDRVYRKELAARLNDGLLSTPDGFERRLTLVSAPAGFGKTTLVGEWLQQSEVLSAWLSLDKRDNDPVRFLSYILAALQRIDPDIGQTAQTMLQAFQAPSMEPLLITLINDIAETRRAFSLVLDDYHLIEESSIHAAVSFLLDHLPPQMHLVIATRADPPLPLAQLRGRGQLAEVHAAGLRFSLDQVRAFLNEVMRLGLAEEQVAALASRTEGWITGLQLAAISMQGRSDVADFIQAFTGSQRYVLDYLTEEVLGQQSEDARTFLLQTAILDRMTAALCQAVTGRTDSQEYLAALESSNLFLFPLDEERCWYRYHRLFSDLLRQRLKREQGDVVPKLHSQASQWYEQNGLIPEAVDHALESGDFDRAVSLIEWTAWRLLARGEMATLLGWLDLLPDDLVHSRPQLCILHAWALAFTGQLSSVEAYLADVGIERVVGELDAVRAYVASHRDDLARAIELCDRALQSIPEQKWFSRGIIGIVLGTSPLIDGDPVAASRALTEAIRYSRVEGQTYLTLIATAMLGDAQEMQGRLRQAAQTQQQALEMASEEDGRLAPWAGMAYVGMAGLLYEWNDLDGALGYAMDGIELSEQGGSADTLEEGYATLAQVYQAQGDLDRAFEMIRAVERLAQVGNHSFWLAATAEARVRLWISQGDIPSAARLVQERRLSLKGGREYWRTFEQMAAVRVLLAQGKADHVLRVLAQLRAGAEAACRVGNAIKFLLLEALAYKANGMLNQALTALNQALQLAEPEGYVRTFLDEGESMATLLRRALVQGIAPGYTASLLAALGEETVSGGTAEQPFIEPLTERELEVLRLVAAGLSNQEIAQELVIALSTVKSHINHIYGKMDVQSRTQAMGRAQSLGLL